MASFTILMQKPREVILKISSEQTKYVRALPLHHSQKETETKKEYSIFTYYIKPTFDFILEISSLGEAAELISPSGFSEELLNMAARMNKTYGDRKSVFLF